MNRAKSIFLACLEQSSPEARRAHAEDACGDDAVLRERVLALLAAHEESDQKPPPPTEGPGTVIGPYKLLEEVGEGGFGVVYVAEQSAPVRRRVALKVIKAGMDTREVVARFEAERQALAIMDHPHIARVFDGGSTPSGRPYFVMELVKGIPIQEYCDQCHLTLPERLELFVKVCKAVQHAHQKGVIHRDLKPSNVLVEMQDGKPAPKVIDFGVAKATGARLTEATFHTRFAQMIGTPQYMSPEQAEMSALDVDTRSDIYSLGVLLYELLTGTTPLTRERLKTIPFDELRRIIREEDPPTPSGRLTSLNGDGAQIAAARRTELRRLVRMVRGELDWIVMRSIEKDRTRRYETATALAADVERYLADEPVEVGPPSRWYRARKFARRNKAALAAAAGISAVVVFAGWSLLDRAARRGAMAKQITAALAETESAYQAGRLPSAMAALQRAEGLAAGGEPSEKLAHRLQRWRVDLAMAARLEEARLARSEAVAHIPAPSSIGLTSGYSFDPTRSAFEYREAFRSYGIDIADLDAAERIEQSAIKDRLLIALYDWLAWKDLEATDERRRLKELIARTDADPWRGRLRAAKSKEALLRLARSPDVFAQPTTSVEILATLLAQRGANDVAVQLLREVQRTHPGDVNINFVLGANLHQLDHRSIFPVKGVGTDAPPTREAVEFLRAALAVRPKSPGIHLAIAQALSLRGDHKEAVIACRTAIQHQPDSAWAYNILGVELHWLRNFDGAVEAHQRAIELRPDMANAHYNLGKVLDDKGDIAGAIDALRSSIKLKAFAETHNDLGAILARAGQLDEAIAEFNKAIELQPDAALALYNLGHALGQKGDAPGAIAALRAAIDHQQDFAAAHYALGRILHGARDFAGAVPHYRAAIRHDVIRSRPSRFYREAIRLGVEQLEHHHIHCALGHVLRQSGDYDAAVTAYSKATDLNPQSAEAHGALAWTLGRQGREPDRAVEHATRATELVPQQAWVWTALGIARFRAGDYRTAADALHESIRLQGGGDANEMFFLAMIHEQLGKQEEAREWYGRAVAWMRQHKPTDPDYHHFHAEAREFLKIEETDKTEKK